MNARINFRSGEFYLTEIEEPNTPETLGQRMTRGGFVICKDAGQGKSRILVVNLSDVQLIELEEPEQEFPF